MLLSPRGVKHQKQTAASKLSYRSAQFTFCSTKPTNPRHPFQTKQKPDSDMCQASPKALHVLEIYGCVTDLLKLTISCMHLPFSHYTGVRTLLECNSRLDNNCRHPINLILAFETAQGARQSDKSRLKSDTRVSKYQRLRQNV